MNRRIVVAVLVCVAAMLTIRLSRVTVHACDLPQHGTLACDGLAWQHLHGLTLKTLPFFTRTS
jgi:hypothetical protein